MREVGELVERYIGQRGDECQRHRDRYYDGQQAVDAPMGKTRYQRREQKSEQNRQRKGDENLLRDAQDCHDDDDC